jgi:glycosyltransferase involved in cell wall biosynthesis
MVSYRDDRSRRERNFEPVAFGNYQIHWPKIKEPRPFRKNRCLKNHINWAAWASAAFRSPCAATTVRSKCVAVNVVVVMTKGISIIVCTHNGESRLSRTLAHLKLQAPTGVRWELVLVDNASTDHTVEAAISCWSDGPVPLRVVREQRLGLQCARERGLKEAKYDFLGFVDDDNWLMPDWVSIAHETLASDPSLGAVGGICEPVFEIPEPGWFHDYHSIYAILTETTLAQCSGTPEFLSGAGLCIRKKAWTQLIHGGFFSLLTDRVGNKLAGGGDTELTLALRLAGWKIKVEPRLRLGHFMPEHRLRWEYLRRLERTYAESHVLLDAYSAHNLLKSGLKSEIGHLWWCQIARSLLRLTSRPTALFAAATSKGEFRKDVIDVERLLGRILGMLRLRGTYGRSRRYVRYAPWRNRGLCSVSEQRLRQDLVV